MRHETIEMVCAHVPKSREPPLQRGGVLGALVQRHLFNLNHRYGSAAVASALLLVTVDGSHHGKILELQVIHKCGLFHTHLHKKHFQ